MNLLVQNLSGNGAITWVSCGAPTFAATPTWYMAGGRPALHDRWEVFANVSLSPRSVRSIVLLPQTGAPPTFRWSNWVADNPAALVPTFRCGPNLSNLMAWHGGQGVRPHDFIEMESENAVRKRFHWRTRIAAIPLTIEGWTDVFSDQDHVEFGFRFECGTTAGTGGQFFDLPAIEMQVGERPIIDYSVTRGLRPPSFIAMPDGSLRWTSEVAKAQRYLRASSIEVRGALLCGPTQLGSATLESERVGNMQHRIEHKVTAMCSAADWAGHWGAYRVLPRPAPAPYPRDEQARRWRGYLSRATNPAGQGDYTPHPMAQEAYSGTTGEQREFGASVGGESVLMAEPWAVADWLQAGDMESNRQINNREPSGEPVRAQDHPRAQLLGRVPDSRFPADMLGHPLNGAWVNSPFPSIDDDQHRSDDAIATSFRLTRDPCQRRTIANILECERMTLGVNAALPALGSGAGIPRAIGRTMKASCQHLASGEFPGFEPLIRRQVERVYQSALWRLNPAAPVQILNLNPSGAKYGWVDPDPTPENPNRTKPIIGWVSWEEAIAIQGFYAAWLALGMTEARDLAVVGAKNLVRNAWFQRDGRWLVCYALRWLGADTPLSRAQLDDPQMAVVGSVTACWVVQALEILIALAPEAPEAATSRQIVAQFPIANWRDANWRAVV